MRLLFVCNYTAQSSYALQARLLIPRLQRLGYEVDVLEIGGSGNTPKMVNGVRLLPLFGADIVGNDCVAAHATRIGADAVVTFFDQFAARGDVLGALNWWAWTPVDHLPLPPIVHAQVVHARGVIAMSRFGERVLRETGYTPFYAPCAYDPSLWYPLPETQRAEVRRDWLHGAPQKFVVVFVGVNDSVPSRKGIPELLAAWKVFSDAHEDVVLYMHTAARGNLHLSERHGVDIPLIMKTLRIRPDSVLFPDDYAYRTGIPQRQVFAALQAADWLVLPSRGEGFGLPLVEAQACGTPVITTRFAAQEELCFDGFLIEGEFEWSWQGASVLKPGIASLVEALEAAYAERDTARYAERRERVAAMALDYAIDRVVELYWLPLLERMAVSALSGKAHGG